MAAIPRLFFPPTRSDQKNKDLCGMISYFAFGYFMRYVLFIPHPAGGFVL